MVVTGGFMYFQKKGMYEDVSLRELAEELQKSNKGIASLIVDCSRIQYLQYFNIHSKYGWNWNLISQRLKSFVANLREINIEPTFYFKGRTDPFLKEKWRTYIELDTPAIAEVYNSLRLNDDSDTKYIPQNYEYFRFILKYECRVKTINIIHNIYAELADIARRDSNCLGILTMNADFIIFDTKPIFTFVKLDFQKLTTQMYTHSQFVRRIGLGYGQLQLLYSLAGNGVIHFSRLQSFHKMVGYEHGLNKNVLLIDRIAKWIKDGQWTGNSEEFPKIAKIAGITEEELRKCISAYEFLNKIDCDIENFPFPNQIEIVKEKWLNCELPTKIYTIVRDRNYVERVNFEDITDTSIPPFSLIYREIRRKVYRLLFNQDIVIEEWCFYPDANLDEPDEVAIHEQEFDGEVPPLELLLSSDNDMDEIRWRLFSYCLNIPFPIEKMKEMNPALLCLCCILRYLFKNGVKLEAWEIQAFICQAINLLANDEECFNEVNELCSRRMLNLSQLVQKGLHNLMYVVTVCGFPFPFKYVMPWQSFNFTLFANCYNQLSEAIPEGKILKYNKSYLDCALDLYEMVTS